MGPRLQSLSVLPYLKYRYFIVKIRPEIAWKIFWEGQKNKSVGSKFHGLQVQRLFLILWVKCENSEGLYLDGNVDFMAKT